MLIKLTCVLGALCRAASVIFPIEFAGIISWFICAFAYFPSDNSIQQNSLLSIGHSHFRILMQL